MYDDDDDSWDDDDFFRAYISGLHNARRVSPPARIL